MPDTVMANLMTVIVAAVIAVAVGLIIFNMVKSRKKGGGCASCSGCPHAGACHYNTNRGR